MRPELPEGALEWHTAATRYLERLGLAEWTAQGCPLPRPGRKNDVRFSPSDYMRRLIRLLGENNENDFKALKLEQGYCSAVGV